jgi:hypothetical protein
MRVISKKYKVCFSYSIKNSNVTDKKTSDCYGGLFRIDTDLVSDTTITLYDFLAEETHMYSKKYIDKLCKIFDLKYTFFENNTIVEVTNFKNKFYLKSFLTLFRILFEGCYYNQKAELNVEFIKSFVENKYKIKDLLERLIHCHNESKLHLGPGHCIKSSNESVKLLTKKDLLNYKPDNYYQVQEFFYNPL